MSYKIQLPQFSGPFEVLLNLIEKEKLDITEVSLAGVTDEFLKYINTLEYVSMNELADFLQIAAKLILLKSRLLIPSALFEQEEENELVDRLKLYREFVNASKSISYLLAAPFYSFAKEKIPLDQTANVSFELNVDPSLLEKKIKSIILTISGQIKLNQKIIKRKVISLREKINELLVILKKHKKVIFNPLIKGKKRAEQAVMFLAVLELMKQKKIQVNQKQLFGEIIIEKLNIKN